ncbi:hypothetical protein [Bartonella sp. B39]
MQGAVSVGNVCSEKTRQIVGVAAGIELYDAANFTQLKTLQSYVAKVVHYLLEVKLLNPLV